MTFISDIGNTTNLKEIFVLGADFMVQLIVGIILLLFVSEFVKKMQEKHDRKKKYKWLYNKTEKYSKYTIGGDDDPRWCSTRDIAKYNNVTLDRADYICSTDKRILLINEENRWHDNKEMWAIKKFIDKPTKMPTYKT